MEYRTLLFKKEKGVAMNTKASDEFGAAFAEAAGDAAVRVIVITGTGRGFCAGGDMKDLPISAGNVIASKETLEAWHKILLGLRQTDKPVIAAINGVAVGAGLDLALMCDMRIAAESARFGEAYVRVGGVPDSGGAFLLPRLIGAARACELLLTGDMIDAREAERIGLINKVVPADKLASVTMELAFKLAAGPPVSMGLIKRSIYLSDSQDIESALRHAALITSLCMATEDAKEGIASFAEKRPPVYKGR
jgi:enoyl-CoA hydratase/carnithine racemase